MECTSATASRATSWTRTVTAVKVRSGWDWDWDWARGWELGDTYICVDACIDVAYYRQATKVIWHFGYYLKITCNGWHWHRKVGGMSQQITCGMPHTLGVIYFWQRLVWGICNFAIVRPPAGRQIDIFVLLLRIFIYVYVLHVICEFLTMCWKNYMAYNQLFVYKAF